MSNKPLCGAVKHYDVGADTVCQRAAGHLGDHVDPRLPETWRQSDPLDEAFERLFNGLKAISDAVADMASAALLLDKRRHHHDVTPREKES